MRGSYLLVLIFALKLFAESPIPGWPEIPEKAAQKMLSGDYAGMVQALKEGAATGDVPSMFYLGRAYQEMKGIPHDYSEARRWYVAAAERGLGPAAWSIGCLYQRGLGTAIDNTQAQTWYRRAAEAGFRRTGLSVIYVRWYPGSDALTQTPPPPGPLHDMQLLTTEELTLLKDANIRGRLEPDGGQTGECGLAARLVVIAQAEITNEVKLPLPLSGSLIYVQQAEKWTKLPQEAETSSRNIRLAPQDAEHPEYTVAMIEREDGSENGGAAFGWRRR